MNWWSPYVGLEFGPINCWSLVTKVYKEQLGIELQSYDTKPEEVRAVHKAISEGQNENIWKAVNDPETFDVVVMKNPRTARIGHVGIMVDSKRVLHIDTKTFSVVVPLTHISVKGRISGFRRMI